MSEVDSAPIADSAAGGDASDMGSDIPGGLSDLARETLAAMEADEKSAPKAQPKKAVAKPKAEAAPPEAPEEEDSWDDTAQAEEKPQPKRYKAKVNGKEYEVPEDRVEAELQRGFALRQKAEEITRREKELEARFQEVQARLEKMEKSPEEFLRGKEDIAEKLLQERAEEYFKLQQMTPQERALYQEKKTAEGRLKEFEAKEKAAEAKHMESLVAEQRATLEKSFSEALKVHKIPANTLSLRVMAGVVRAAAMKGQDISTADAAELTRQQLRQVSRSSYDASDVEGFISEHPELADGIRKHFAKKASSPAREVGDVRPQARQAASGDRRPNGQFKPTASKEKWEQEIEDLKKRGTEERRKNGWW